MCQFNTSFLSVWQHSHHRYYILGVDTVQQDNLLVIFGEFVCNTLFILHIQTVLAQFIKCLCSFSYKCNY